MNVFYFSSDLFASVMSVSMLSLLDNNRSFGEIKFYIVDDGISEENKKNLLEMVSQYNSADNVRGIVFIDAPDPVKAFRFPFKSRYQMGHSYPRMLIGSILPDSVDRVLCLDSDTLVCGDLQDLWNRDLGCNIMAGVSDCMNIIKYSKQFQMTDEMIYCNAGMFLVDLKKWREQKIEKKIIRRIHKQNGNVFFFEQTLMNWACGGKILALPPEYNCYTLFWAFSYKDLIRWRKPLNFFQESEVLRAKEDPKIIHFTRNFYMLSRPWVKGCDHPMTAEYIRYKQMTPWPKLDEDTRSEKQRKKYELWHKLPLGLMISGASFIYNEVRPKIWWKNE